TCSQRLCTCVGRGFTLMAAGWQSERRGGAGPAGACLAVRTPPAAGNHLVACFIAWVDETPVPEHIIIAGGGVVVRDVGHQVHAHGSAGDDVDAAALPEAGAAPAAGSTAVGRVVD